MELLPLVCLCLLSWSGTTSADHHVVVEQDGDVILPCSNNGVNIEQKLFDWKKEGQTEVYLYDSGIVYGKDRTGQAEQFKGRVSHFKDELKHGNASIKIRNAKMADSGDYTCYFPLLQPPQKFHIKLVVEPVLKDRTGENIPGAAPEPSVTFNHTKNSALLQCKVNGVPHLKVEWKDSDGNILAEDERDSGTGRVSITLLITVTKTGIFRCVATQKNLSHRISNQVQVYFHDNTGLVVAAVLGPLLVVIGVVVLLVVLIAKGCIKLNCNKDKKQPNQETEPALPVL